MHLYKIKKFVCSYHKPEIHKTYLLIYTSCSNFIKLLGCIASFRMQWYTASGAAVVCLQITDYASLPIVTSLACIFLANNFMICKKVKQLMLC